MISFLFLMVQSGTALLFATLGEILTEKVGNLNLGVEGTMLVGSVSGFYIAHYTQSPILAMLSAIVSGLIFGLIYSFLCVTLRTNQVVTGLSITILGSGISSFVGKDMMGYILSDNFKMFFSNFEIPILSKIPIIGEVFFSQNIFVYLSYISIIVVTIYINYTKYGLNLRMVGENPAAADSNGISVSMYKYINISLGSALCALGGAYLSIAYIPSWQENVVAGRGWIAVSLVIFCTWRTSLVLLGSYFFGALSILGFRVQNSKFVISPYLIDMLPYLMTLLVLIFISMNEKARYFQPESLGQSYFREDR